MYVRAHACSKQYRAYNHLRAIAHYPFSGQPPPSCPALFHEELPPSLLCHTNPYLHVLPPTTHIAHLDLPAAQASLFVSVASPLLQRTPPPPPPIPFTHHVHPSLSLSLVLFLFRLPQTPDPIHPAGTAPYIRHGAVSTGTPARSLKENAIIRRTSTNELIVGASCYRQYWQVLYSTSPGATRL